MTITHDFTTYIIDTEFKDVLPILESLKEESQNPDPTSNKDSVWFNPEKGVFLYRDFARPYEQIYYLILNGFLVYQGIENYQGSSMLKYTLTKHPLLLAKI
jgi:hypothetical protein